MAFLDGFGQCLQRDHRDDNILGELWVSKLLGLFLLPEPGFHSPVQAGYVGKPLLQGIGRVYQCALD
jgi:hypothetical protein